MKLNFNECKLNHTVNSNSTVTCHFNEVLDFTLEPIDIFTWIDNCEDQDILSAIITKARYRKHVLSEVLSQEDDDDFRSRA